MSISQDLNAPHNHEKCIEVALNKAKAHCERSGARLTRLRKEVLKLVWQSHSPLGAYSLIKQLEQTSSRDKVGPPTVYRALDFLVEQGLVYKVRSLNAFIGVSTHNQKKVTFLVCQECGFTEEVTNNSIQQAINLLASQHRFSVNHQVMEILGLCAKCKKKSL
ncbi:Fur family transcriptional regulator [Teredinibacter sp. KSP-S5-2]|uniref:Fur family transcriptional regulator n=1 Tax=Teredinibacter sp. KSP-S5-2 TaxID=3034506 RepID=UPI0029349A1B|nr:Fur family transcriptional regulator [Teredinibacter sp. KSP-S5-2]WNO09216.1 Fur family transcriptional regulator [Teredinibacter sp. KSP-S5-2]